MSAVTTLQARIPYKPKIKVGRILLYIVFILVTLVFISPIIWVFLTSLKLQSEYSIYPVVIIPKPLQWINYKRALFDYPYFRYFWNSVKLAIPTTAITVLSSALAGFAFARLEAPFKRILFILVLSMLMVPRMVTAIPNFMLFAKLGLVDTYYPWYLWALSGSSFHIFLFRQFFSTIPKDLEDAAEVDGCNRFRIFWQIFLPLSGPVVATSAIFHFQWAWGDWFTPQIFLSELKTTLSVFLARSYPDPKGLPLETVTFAGVMIYLLPMLIIFFIAQKYIVQGVVTTGLKG